MARIVLHERNRPYIVKVGDQELHLCACGLSGNKPYCDGTHKRTLDEEENSTYMYDKVGRSKLESFYPKQ
ncbi:MAG: CDGSH iron-sulfur domain-containing protein [Thermoplasmataceae archaeon]|jgi:CDGSH-type Zn-finger protein|nr:CDGSH iron-sulfur domain-containing protein [Candidatus Thermoplasmatota archaeon]